MKILFIAGGSGGHITPALAVADAVRRIAPETEILFVSSEKSIDDEVFKAHAYEYRRETLPAGKLRRHFSFQNLVDFFRFPSTFLSARKLLKKEKPDILFSKGGYVALPIGLAAKLLGIPVIIHESDAVPGLSNRILRKIALHMLTAFPSRLGECVGTPIREEIFRGDPEKGRKFLGFSPKEKILLVMGGSQGAEQINTLLLHALDAIEEKMSVVHISGKGKTTAKETRKYRHFPYLGAEYPDVLAAADIVVSRAGANSLFEFAAAKKPILLIPLLTAANDHQKKNAGFFSEKGMAIVVGGENPTSSEFQKAVIALAENDELRKKMSERIKVFGRKDSAEKIAHILLSARSDPR